MKKCKQCGKPNPTRKSTCSYECATLALKSKEEAKKAKKKREKWEKARGITETKCDKLWSKVVRSIGRCEYCGKTDNLNAHHIFGRRNFSIRWDVDNGVCLCSGCHKLSSIFSAHETPTEFTHWIESKRGTEFMKQLTEKKNKIGKPNIEEVYKELSFIATHRVL